MPIMAKYRVTILVEIFLKFDTSVVKIFRQISNIVETRKRLRYSPIIILLLNFIIL